MVSQNGSGSLTARSARPRYGPIEIPSDHGVKIEQLKTLAALRDSGALTEKEFQAEKRRVLDGG